MRARVQAVSVNRVTPHISSSHSSQAASPPPAFSYEMSFFSLFVLSFWLLFFLGGVARFKAC